MGVGDCVVPDELVEVEGGTIVLELLVLLPDKVGRLMGGVSSSVKLKKRMGDSKTSVRIRPARLSAETLCGRRTESVSAQKRDIDAFRVGTRRLTATPFTMGGKFFSTHAPQLFTEEFQLFIVSQMCSNKKQH